MPRPLRVFLCHASQDKPAVRKLHRYLKQHGIEPWLDELDLLPGENWEVEIPRALNASDVILVCLSKNSVNKEGYVQKEISFALDKALEKPDSTIFIIPAKLEPCDVPGRLNRYQWVDLFRPDSNKRLLLGLNKRALDIGADVAPVILEDTRQRKITPKPASLIDHEAADKLAREQTEREVREKENRERAIREKAAKAKVERDARSNPRGKFASWVSSNPLAFLLSGISIIVLLFIIFGGKYFAQNFPSATQTPFVTASATVQPPTPTSTPVPPTPTLEPGATIIGGKGDTLVYVPAGEFMMGSDSSDQTDEGPAHTVYLDAFWLNQTEVTNKQYKACVDAGTCEPPSNISSNTHPSYYGNPEFDNYPVVYVNWDKANRYCTVWIGGSLPTEAQWEKAARGPDGNMYPWGNDLPNSNLLNYNENIGDTTEVGKYPNGTSVYGVLDMAGNVWEWVNDWYDGTYYSSSPTSNPLGPDTGQYRVLRGGSWLNYASSVGSANRLRSLPTVTGNVIGFRCSRSP